MGGEAECSAPSAFEAVPVFDDAVEVLDLCAPVVAFLPCGCAVGDLLVGVQFFYGDGDCPRQQYSASMAPT